MTTIKGLDALNRKLKTLENFQRAMKKPVAESLNLMHDYIATAPRKKAGAFTALATPGQRRAYWAKVRQAEKEGSSIHGPHGYKRTSTIVRKWTMRIQSTSGGVRGELGNYAEGAIFVQSAEAQQPFHKASGWRTDEQTIEKTAKKVQAVFDDAIKRELNR